MDMSEGEIFDVLEKLDDGWWSCVSKKGETGLLPGNYLVDA
jgi:hypothetical protein